MQHLNLRHFIQDEAGADTVEYTVFALIIFLIVVFTLIPIGNRLEWLWRGLQQILHEVADMATKLPVQ